MMQRVLGCGAASCCERKCSDWALLVLRIVLGVIFINHGYGKLFGGNPGIPAFTGMLMGLGFPLAKFFAWVVGLTEFFGGIGVLVGLGTRTFARLLAIVMALAFLVAKKAGLPAGDVDFALFGIAIAVSMCGPGRLALMPTRKTAMTP